jgi:long-chain fatty acid transport protein
MSTEQDTGGFAVSADIGMLWRAASTLGVGVVAKLPYRIHKDGEIRLNQSLTGMSLTTDTSVEERYPARVGVGCDFRPRAKHLVALSATWMNWSQYRQNIDYEIEIPGMLEDTSGNPNDWHDSWVVNLGYEYALSELCDLRCGLLYDQAPDPEEARTVVGGKILDVWTLSLGAARQYGDARLNCGYSYTYGPDSPGYVPGADYSMTYHELYVGIDWLL